MNILEHLGFNLKPQLEALEIFYKQTFINNVYCISTPYVKIHFLFYRRKIIIFWLAPESYQGTCPQHGGCFGGGGQNTTE